MRRDVFYSFILYSLGLGSILVADLYVVKTYDQSFIADWAFIKSAITIIGTICLMGYDQAFIRDVTLIKRVFGEFITNTILISLLSTVIIYFIKDYSSLQSLYFSIAIMVMALLTFFAAASRANFNLWKSQFSTNFWKIFLLLILLIFPFQGPLEMFLLALLLSVIISYLLKGFHSYEKKKEEIINPIEAKNLGYSFLLGNLTLIFAVHGEQFLINIYGSEEISAHLFTYFSIFTPIALSINGFMGFYLGPKVREENNMNYDKYLKLLFLVLFYSFVITGLSIFVGLIYLKLLNTSEPVQLDYLLILSLALMCIVRGIYVSTSVCLGVFGNAKFIRNMAKETGLISILYVCTIFCILVISKDIKAALLISLASTLNWAARLYISHKYSVKTLQNKLSEF